MHGTLRQKTFEKKKKEINTRVHHSQHTKTVTTHENSHNTQKQRPRKQKTEYRKFQKTETKVAQNHTQENITEIS